MTMLQFLVLVVAALLALEPASPDTSAYRHRRHLSYSEDQQISRIDEARDMIYIVACADDLFVFLLRECKKWRVQGVVYSTPFLDTVEKAAAADCYFVGGKPWKKCKQLRYTLVHRVYRCKRSAVINSIDSCSASDFNRTVGQTFEMTRSFSYNFIPANFSLGRNFRIYYIARLQIRTK